MNVFSRIFPRLSIPICLPIAFFLATACVPDIAAAIDNPCDPDFISFNAEGNAVVSATGDMTGAGDTLNLQCLADALVGGVPFDWINLGPGYFYLGHVDMECPRGKKCTLSGKTKDATKVTFPDGSIDCSELASRGIYPSGFTFIRDWILKNMTFSVLSPCLDGDTFAGLSFTGPPAMGGSSCPDTVMNTLINNVSVFAENGAVSSGVFVGPTGPRFGSSFCQDRLLGTITSNRLRIEGPVMGVFTSMQAGSRDSHDFLTVRNTEVGYFKNNSNQITTINFCTIDVLSLTDRPSIGISKSRDSDGPRFSNTNISNCTINVDSTKGGFATGVFILDTATPSNFATAITKTVFNSMGSNSRGLWVTDSNNGTFTQNRFSGDGLVGLALDSKLATVSDWAILGNNGWPGFASDFDVFMSAGTSNNVVGVHKGATVGDDGCNFDLNQSGGGCAAEAIRNFQKSSLDAIPPSASMATSAYHHGAGSEELMRHQSDLLERLNIKP